MDLANNRIASLGAAARDKDTFNGTRRAPAEAAAQSKSFVGKFGYKIGWTGFTWNGTLVVAPDKISFIRERW